MMLPEFGTKEFDKYLKDLNSQSEAKRHKYYEETKELAEDMAVHTLGKKPKKILERKRPHEDEDIRKYRLESYEPVTLSSCNKVISVVNRIYNPRLYNIQFPEPNKKIKEGYDLETYLSEELPLYGSMMRFIENVYTKHSFTDPNSVIFIEPITYDIIDTDYLEPTPKIYSSKCLLDFKEYEYYVIEKEETELCIVDTMWVRYFTRENKDKEWIFNYEYEHGFGYTPAFRIGGNVLKADDPMLFQSFIAGVLPHWNKAIGLKSDFDGSMTNNIYPERWEYTTESCGACKGNGTIETELINVPIPHGSENTKVDVACSKCNGTGKVVSRSPFKAIQINPDPLNPEAKIPTPPAGYIQKEVETIKILKEEVKDEMQNGFFAINMDIILRVGENQSGVAKTIDRQDLDSFLLQISNHTFKRIIPGVVYYIARWLYSTILTPEQIDEQLPKIESPVTFDVLSVNNLLEELQNIKQSGLSNSIINGLQKDIINKRFNSEFVKKKLTAELDLDPLSGLDQDDILTGVSNGTVSKEDLYIHQHMTYLINLLLNDDPEFLDKDYVEKMDLLYIKAKEKLTPVETIETPIDEPEGI